MPKQLRTVRRERVNNAPRRTEASVHLLVVMFLCVLVMHFGFAALVVYHDYIAGGWVAHVKPSYQSELPDSLWNFIYWFYIYIPAAFFLYGLWELGPLWSVFRHRKQIVDEDIRFHSAPLAKNTLLLAVLGIVLTLMMWLLVLTFENTDHFGVQMMLIIAWGAALKIGWLIGKW